MVGFALALEGAYIMATMFGGGIYTAGMVAAPEIFAPITLGCAAIKAKHFWEDRSLPKGSERIDYDMNRLVMPDGSHLRLKEGDAGFLKNDKPRLL